MLKTDKGKIQYKIEALTANFGKAWFLELLSFLIEIRESRYEIKILMARRFFDIYCAFEDIIDYLYEGSVKTVGRVVTNLSMALLENQLQGKKILVVDDIILHGRALNDVFLYLTDTCKCRREDIDFKVFVRNKDKKLISSEAFLRLNTKRELDNSRWRSLSSGIINALIITGQPYVSYLPYAEYDMESEEAFQIFKWMENAEVEDITSREQDYYGVKAGLWFPQKTDPVDSLFSFAEQSMVRIYQYEKLSKLVILPYVFLRPVTLEGVKRFTRTQKEYVQFLWDEAGTGNGAQESYSSERGKYACSIMTYLSSMAFGNLFLEKCNILSVKWADRIENISLGCRSIMTRPKADEMLAMFQANSQTWFWQKDADVTLSCNSQIIQNMLAEASELRKNHKVDMDWFMDHYLPLIGRLDGELAEKDKGRMPGVGIPEFACICKGTSQEELWKKVVKVIDSGKGTLMLVLSKINGRNLVDSLLMPGEQSPTCNEENRICLALPMMQWEAFCKLNNVEVAECHKRELMFEILEKYPALKEGLSVSEMEDLVKEGILEEYEDYYLRKIDMYESFSMLKGAMRIEKEYERKK